MEQILCIYCGDLFPPSPRHKGQTSCKKPECKSAKKAEWQRHKMHTDPDYRLNQKLSQKQWAKANPGYWREYRRNNPEKAERNRLLQAIRNRKARPSDSVAKMDSSKVKRLKVVGQFYLVPVIAKKDSLKVNIIKIPICYP